MAAKSICDGLGKQVTCAICLEHYSDPRLLPCLHTYCRQCLQDLLAKEKRKVSVVCPECREEVQIASGDVSKLRVNFWINNLLSLLDMHWTGEKDGGKTRLTCENCDSKVAAEGRCVNCCMFLCNVCFTAHQRLLALKDHQLMTLNELKETGIPIIEKQVFCAKHKGEVLRLFCNTCQKLVCRDCAIIDHRNDDFTFIEDVAREHKEMLKQEIRKASNTSKNIEVIIKSVQEIKNKVEWVSGATEKDVDNFIGQQIKVLEDKRTELKKETRSIAVWKIKELDAQEESLAMHLMCLRSAIEFTGTVLNNGCDSDVLMVSSQIASRLSQLSEKPFAKSPCQDDKIRLKVSEYMFSDCVERCAEIIDAINPDPDYSIVTPNTDGLVEKYGIFYAVNGQDLEFVASIKNLFGDKLRCMENRIEAKTMHNKSKPQKFDIKSRPDCTYSFTVTFANVSTMNIQVTIDGKSIQRSPITIKCLRIESASDTTFV